MPRRAPARAVRGRSVTSEGGTRRAAEAAQGAAGDSGEVLLLADDEARLADIIEGASWSSADSEPAAGAARAGSLRGRPPAVQRQSSLPAAEPWPPLDADVELRRRPAPPDKPKAAEPNIDLELDVKVHINSGKCVLHTEEPPRDEEPRGGRPRVGRSASGGLGAPAEPQGGGAGSPGARRRPAGAARLHAAPDATVFRVPGLQLKVHYDSRTLPDEAAPGARKLAGKKAALFAWITLQSIPEETVISPHILEFLERTLEPIPVKPSFSPPAEGECLPAPPPPPARPAVLDPSPRVAAEEGDAAGAAYGQYVYASFPVDVIVHFHMQPSTFRFSCLPASRVECLLQLPTLQIVFSSKRATDE